MQSPAIPNERLTANLLCMASMLVWALGFPAADLLLGPVPPLQLTMLRMVLATGVLIPLWLWWEGPAALRAANWGRGALIGAIGFGLGAFMLVYAQSLTDPVTVAVISSTMPVVGIAIECLMDGRRLTATLILGMTLSLIGGIVAYAARLDGLSLGDLGLGFGALLAFLSLITFSWGSRLTVTEFPHLSAIGRTTVTLAGAALATSVMTVVATSLGGPVIDWQGVGMPEVGALLIYGLGSLALSQLLWIIGVGRLGIGIASMHINAAPFYVMIFMFALGAAWNWWQAAGALVVAAGVFIAQVGGSLGAKEVV